jgi:hypothetical protein
MRSAAERDELSRNFRRLRSVLSNDSRAIRLAIGPTRGRTRNGTLRLRLTDSHSINTPSPACSKRQYACKRQRKPWSSPAAFSRSRGVPASASSAIFVDTLRLAARVELMRRYSTACSVLYVAVRTVASRSIRMNTRSRSPFLPSSLDAFTSS